MVCRGQRLYELDVKGQGKIQIKYVDMALSPIVLDVRRSYLEHCLWCVYANAIMNLASKIKVKYN